MRSSWENEKGPESLYGMFSKIPDYSIYAVAFGTWISSHICHLGTSKAHQMQGIPNQADHVPSPSASFPKNSLNSISCESQKPRCHLWILLTHQSQSIKSCPFSLFHWRLSLPLVNCSLLNHPSLWALQSPFSALLQVIHFPLTCANFIMK